MGGTVECETRWVHTLVTTHGAGNQLSDRCDEFSCRRTNVRTYGKCRRVTKLINMHEVHKALAARWPAIMALNQSLFKEAP